MKKLFLSIVVSMMLSMVMQGQNPVRPSTDTLPCVPRQANYWYSDWYDTTRGYLYGSALDSIHVYNDGRDTFYYHWTPNEINFGMMTGAQPLGHPDHTEAIMLHAPHPVRIKGLWAMVSQYAYEDVWPIMDSSWLPEDLHLYVPKSGADTIPINPPDTTRPDTGLFSIKSRIYLERIATVRWDTAHPKMMCLPKTQDPAFAGVNAYCHVYEVMFDTVYTIEGEFWIGGSCRSNSLQLTTPPFGHQHFPIFYLSFGNNLDRWHSPYAYRASAPTADGPFHTEEHLKFGPFGVITDGQRYVEVVSNDTAQGLALYTAFYPDSSYQSITAVPKRGFRFSHWNDSVTDIPRTIFVTSDTSFTAYFDSLPEYRVGAESSDGDLGDVVGGGSYYEGETARIQARANRGGRFVCWNDSVTDNPRSVLVTRDTSFTAIFEPLPLYNLNVSCNNQSYGYVTGDGTFYEGEQTYIGAYPHEGYYFLRWSDGSGFIYRSVVVTQDTSFEAIFWPQGEPVGIRGSEMSGVRFRLMPNPVSGKVRCEMGEDFVGGELTVVNAAGRVVVRRELASGTRTLTLDVAELPAGTYFVTLVTKEGTATRRLVVE